MAKEADSLSDQPVTVSDAHIELLGVGQQCTNARAGFDADFHPRHAQQRCSWQDQFRAQ